MISDSMTNDITRVHEAAGRIILTAVHVGRDATGLEAITAMRWRDEAGHFGQDSHVRLALHIERGGEIWIEQQGHLVSITLEPGDRFLQTEGAADEMSDPILALPRY